VGLDGFPQEAPVVEPNRAAGDAELSERLEAGGAKLDFRGNARLADNVYIALDKLTETALLRALRPPHGCDMGGLERHGQLVEVVGHKAGEGHREVETQPRVG
jgi:hypothetical protein